MLVFMKEMLLPFQLGLGGPIGSGRQVMSWIHRDDLVALLLAAVEDARWSGVVNATSPEPVSSKEFAKALGRGTPCRVEEHDTADRLRARDAVSPAPGRHGLAGTTACQQESSVTDRRSARLKRVIGERLAGPRIVDLRDPRKYAA